MNKNMRMRMIGAFLALLIAVASTLAIAEDPAFPDGPLPPQTVNIAVVESAGTSEGALLHMTFTVEDNSAAQADIVMYADVQYTSASVPARNALSVVTATIPAGESSKTETYSVPADFMKGSGGSLSITFSSQSERMFTPTSTVIVPVADTDSAPTIQVTPHGPLNEGGSAIVDLTELGTVAADMTITIGITDSVTAKPGTIDTNTVQFYTSEVGATKHVTVSVPADDGVYSTDRKVTLTFTSTDTTITPSVEIPVVETEDQFTFTLKPGWNLISVPLTLTNQPDFWNALNSNDAESIYAYYALPESSKIYHYTTSQPEYTPGDLDPSAVLSNGYGIWVNCNTQYTAQAVGHPKTGTATLTQGWNLVYAPWDLGGSPTGGASPSTLYKPSIAKSVYAYYPSGSLSTAPGLTGAGSRTSGYHYFTENPAYAPGDLSSLVRGMGYFVNIETV
jgi:hypothetical protein